jgi:23S rRNA pseudouridine2605 synthase
MAEGSKIRLHKLLARAGLASRRRAEALIRAGQVKVDGKVVTELGTMVDPRQDRVDVDGQRVRPAPPQYRVLLKPRACLATLAPSAKDSAERRSIRRFIPDDEVGWQVVAPLDFLSEGVILLTTDGALAERMSRGGGRVAMTYHLKFQGAIGEQETARLLRGWRWEGRPVKPSRVEPLATTGKNTWVEVVVPESRPRALKSAGEMIRHTVLKISRVRLGEISFEGLRMGGFRELSKREVKSLLSDAGLSAP